MVTLRPAVEGKPAAAEKADRFHALAPESVEDAVHLADGVDSIPPEVQPLFKPIVVGNMNLKTRLVYPPLTRCRASHDNLPQPHMATYYSQRAWPGGLIISEGTFIAKEAAGYPHVPGIWSQEQVEAWKPIVQEVHDKGAYFFLQLYHCGRAAHPVLTGGLTPVSSSKLAITSDKYRRMWNGKEMVDYPVPAALDKAGIKERVAMYAQGAKNAITAGFDGVEIHVTKDSANQRTDEYGGSIERRCRFALEVVEALVEAVGAHRVGLRLSPFNDFLDCTDSTPYSTFMYLVERVTKCKLAYLHMVEDRIHGDDDKTGGGGAFSLDPYRKVFPGPFISAGGYQRASAVQAITSGHADLVSVGRWWISNPDLPKRFILNAPLNKYDRSSFYLQDPVKGYIDYPFLEGDSSKRRG